MTTKRMTPNRGWAQMFYHNATEIDDLVEGHINKKLSAETLFKAAQVATAAETWREAARLLEREPVKHYSEDERVRNALVDLVSWFTEPTHGRWMIPSGDTGADDAVKEAREALVRADGEADDVG